MTFDERLSLILEKKFDENYKAVVGIVQMGDRWLLGLACATDDDRAGKWAFPGGRIERSDRSVEAAAEREVREETGIRCRAVGKAFTSADDSGVAFVHCRASPGQRLDNNHEFSALGWFTTKEMRSLRLHRNVMKLIDRVRRR